MRVVGPRSADPIKSGSRSIRAPTEHCNSHSVTAHCVSNIHLANPICTMTPGSPTRQAPCVSHGDPPSPTASVVTHIMTDPDWSADLLRYGVSRPFLREQS